MESIEELKRTEMPRSKEKKLGKLVLSAQKINFSYPGQELLRDVSFSVHKGERVALVGPNGVGKTTLIDIIRGETDSESGKVIIAKNTNIGFLPQTIRGIDLPDSGTVGDFVKSARGLDKLEKQMGKLEERMLKKPEDNQAIERFGELMDNFQFLGGFEADQEANRLLAGLGLKDVELESQVNILSGGQKTRLFLARVLFSNPDLLLLDEPTNHLDEPVLEWLADYLENFKGALLVVSHDRKFLDATVDKVLRLNEFTHQIEEYPGNYSNFLILKEEREQSLAKQRKNQEKEIQRLYRAINRWRKRGKRARAAKVMEKRVARMKGELVETSKRAKRSKFRFEVKEKSYQHVLHVDSLDKSFDGKTVVRDVSFDLYRGERLVILGPNGAGKSTLLKLIVGDLKADAGEISLGRRVGLGYYAQEHEVLDFDSVVLEEARTVSDLPENKLRAALGRFLFTGDDAFKKVSMLSPGERTRLVLAKLMLGGFNTLILDEPTNHLDMESRERLMEVLSEFDGSIIITSHDGALLDKLDPDKVLIMPEGKLEYKLVV